MVTVVTLAAVVTVNGGNRGSVGFSIHGTQIRVIMTNVRFSVYGYCGNTGCSDNWKWW